MELVSDLELEISKILSNFGVKEPVRLSVPKKEEFGDLTLYGFDFLIKKHNLEEKRDEIIEKIKEEPYIMKVEIKKGNLNIFLNYKEIWKKLIGGILERGIDYFIYKLKKEKDSKIIVLDYFSPNIGKIPHYGNFRSAIIGSCLRNIFELFGDRVIGVNWVGDLGTGFGSLLYAYKKWGDLERVKKEGVKYLMELYRKFHKEKEKNPKLWEEAKKEHMKLELADPETLKIHSLFCKLMMDRLRKTWYRWFNLRYEDENGESYYLERAKKLIEECLQKGIALKENGTIRVDLTKFGLDRPVLQKSDGTTLYLTRDTAAAIVLYEKYKYDLRICVVAREQETHFKQQKAILRLLGYPFWDKVYHLKFGLVLAKTKEGIKKFSTRKGIGVTTEDAIKKCKLRVKRKMLKEKKVEREKIDETSWKIAIGAIIFFILKYDPSKDIVFEWKKILDTKGFSHIPVAYSVVRANGILRRLPEIPKIDEIDKIDYSPAPEESSILRKFLEIRELLENCYKKYSIHLIPRYLYELSMLFNKFYEKWQVLLEKNKNARLFRIFLVMAFYRIMKEIYSLLNISLPEKM